MSSKRDQFEHQLRDLQNDISNLSQKLNLSSIRSTSKPTKDVTIFASSHSKNDKTQVVLNNTNNNSNNHISNNNNNQNKYDRNETLDHLRQDLHLYKKERDDAIYKFEQLKVEMEEMKKSLQEAMRMKASYEHLKQEYDSIKISLESSERIRKQQKELINLLQRSHSIAIASDSNSVTSFNSNLSSISIKGAGGFDHINNEYSDIKDHINNEYSDIKHKMNTAHNNTSNNNTTNNISNKKTVISPSLIAAENKDWLNTHNNNTHNTINNNILKSNQTIKSYEKRKSKRKNHILTKANNITTTNNNNTMNLKTSNSIYDPVFNNQRYSNMLNNSQNNSQPIIINNDLLAVSNSNNSKAPIMNISSDYLNNSYQSIVNMNDSLVPSINSYDMNLNNTSNNNYTNNNSYSNNNTSNINDYNIRSSILSNGKPPRHPSITPTTITPSNPRNTHVLNNNTSSTSLDSSVDYRETLNTTTPIREPALLYNQQHYLLNQTNLLNSNIINQSNNHIKRSNTASNSISIKTRQSNLLMNRPPPKRMINNNTPNNHHNIKRNKDKIQLKIIPSMNRQFKKPVSAPLTTFGMSSRKL